MLDPATKKQIMKLVRDDIRSKVLVAITAKFPNHSDSFVEEATKLFDIEISQCAYYTALNDKLEPDIAGLLGRVSLCVASTIIETKLNFSEYK